MSNTIIKATVAVGQTGMQAVEDGGKAINRQLKDMATNAAVAKKGMQGLTTPVSNTLTKAKAASAPTQSSGGGGDDRRDYSVSRGLGGSTGAAGRDFAKQSQGLGGVVHLYATLAANLFAVSAAFGALRKAADTTNMIKGMDQLGAATGRNLSGLSKEVAELTDGAVSLKEAMTSVAQASSAGMSDENIKRLTVGAKNASAALGLSMTDALSRLSRGISKIEPELLDELGIFVKVDKASQDYARTIGKTAASLTDFEKRAGFAVAVLSQVEEKFGSMETTANPFSKLVASLENLIQSGLEFVNKVLGPVAKFFAESPAALTAMLAVLATVLGKMAFPQVSNMLENARGEAEKTAKVVSEKTKRMKEYGDDLHVNRMNQASELAEKQFMAEKSTVDRLDAIKKQRYNKSILGEDTAKQLRSSNITDLSPEDRAAMQKRSAALLAMDDERYKRQGRLLAVALAEEQDIRQTMKTKGDAVADQNEKQRYLSRGAVLDRELKAAERRAAKSNIFRNALSAADADGFKTGLANLNEGIKKNGELADGAAGKLTNWGAKGTKVIGVTKLAAQSVFNTASTMLGMVGVAGQVAGVVAAIVMGIDSWATKNEKEFSKFTESLQKVETASTTLANTQEKYSKGNAFTIQGVSAQANAMDGLADSVIGASKSFDTLQAATSGWDSFTDSFWDFFGRGSADKLSDTLSNSITQGIQGIEDNDARNAMAAKMGKLLGNSVDVRNVKELRAALRSLSNEELADFARKAGPAFKEMTAEAKKSTDGLMSLKSGLAETSKLIQTQITALTPSDAFSKLGVSISAQSTQMTAAMKNPKDAMLALQEVIKDVNILSLLSPESATELIQASDGIEKLNKEYSKYVEDKLVLEAKLVKAREDSREYDNKTGAKVDDRAAKDILLQLDLAEARKTKLLNEMSTIQQQFGKKIELEFAIKGIDLITKGLATSMQEAAITAAKSFSSAMKSAKVDTTEYDIKIQGQELAVQQQLLNATYEQAKAVARNSLAVEENTASRERERLEAKPNKTAAEEVQLQNINTTLTKLAQSRNLLGKSPTELLALAKNKSPTADNADTQRALASLGPLLGQAAGFLAGQAKIGATAAGQKVVNEVNRADKRLKDNQTEIAQRGEINQLAIEENNLQISLSDSFNQSLQDKKMMLEYAALSLANEKKQADFVGEQEKINAVKGVKGNTDEILRAEKALNESKLAADKKYEQDKEAIRKNSFVASLKGAEEIRVREAAMATARLTDINNAKAAELNASQQRLDYLSSIGALEAEQHVRKSADIALAQQEIAYSTQRNAILSDFATKEKAIQIAKESTSAPSATLLAEEKALAASKTSQLNTLDAINSSTRENISLMAEQNAMLAKQATIMEDMASLTATMALSFGEVGAAVGASLTAIVKLGQNEEKYLKTKAKLQDQINDTNSDPKDIRIAKELEGKLDKENAIQKLNAMGEIAGQSKKMFKEETAAYKILGAIEAANHAAAMVMQAEKMASTLASLPGTLSEAFGMLVKQSGWAGFAGIAALLAAIASVGGSSGGTVTMPSGFSSADQQAVQGTGQSYHNGALVDNGGGVFGDSTAKSETIVKGIEEIEKHTFSTMEYSNKMLISLNAIKENTAGLSKVLVRIPGLTSSDSETRSSGNWLTGKSESSVVGKGLQILGNIGDVIAGLATINTYKNVQTTKSGFLGFGGGTSFNTQWSGLDSREAKASIGGIFKNFVSLLTDAGAELGRTGVEAMLSGMTISDNFMVDSMGLSGQELVDAILEQVGIEIDIASAQVFPELTKFQTFGESFADTIIRMASNAQDFALAIESIGVSFTKLPETVGVVTEAMTTELANARTAYDKALADSKVLITETYLDQVSDAGYTYSTKQVQDPKSLLALADANERLTIALGAVNKATSQTTTNNLDLQQSLIDGAGGMEAFITKSEFFKDNFLSEEERLAPIRKRVTTEMDRLGLSMITTREQFKDYVRALDLSNPVYATTYTALMNVAEGFAAITETADTATESVSKVRELEIRIMELSGRRLEALLARREDELKDLTDSEKALQRHIYILEASTAAQSRLDDLILTKEEKKQKTRTEELELLGGNEKAIYKYLYAMEDVVEAKDTLFSMYDRESNALTTLANKLRTSSQTLRDFTNSLLVGAESLKTPKQRYDEAKAQFDSLVAVASSEATTDAQQAAKDSALSKVSGAASTFLEASRTYFASSDAYAADFTNVLAVTNALADTLDNQATDIEKQLGYLEQQVTALGYIKTATESVYGAVGRVEAAILTLVNSKAVAASLEPASSAAFDTISSSTPTVPTTSSSTDSTTISGWSINKAELLSKYSVGDASSGEISQLYMDVFHRGADAGGLAYWDESGKTVSQILDGFLLSDEAKTLGITGYARGGLAKGLSLVGERGPELVDFSSQARVYPANHTAGMIGGVGAQINKLTEKLDNIQKELIQLRKEQQKQTGDLIMSNFDANRAASETVTEAIESSNDNWNERAKVALK